MDASDAFSALSMLPMKISKNWSSDVWYMTFTSDSSTTEKYSTEPLVATGLNCSLFSLMDFFVSSAATSFWFTSAAFAYVRAADIKRTTKKVQ